VDSTISPREPTAPSSPAAGAPPASAPAPPRRATFAFMRRHPAHWIAFGFGSGLAPRAPGTVGTLWAWVSFLVLDHWLDATGWAVLIVLALLAGQWAATRTAQHLGVADPGAIVWDEVVAFWIVLWVLMPAPWWAQLAAFALFRYFDAAKPGPVRWADRLFKQAPGQAIGWRQGVGILFDDLVAAGCTLIFIALWVRLWNS
jgi:phosphatidylglycerophosphatase A